MISNKTLSITIMRTCCHHFFWTPERQVSARYAVKSIVRSQRSSLNLIKKKHIAVGFNIQSKANDYRIVSLILKSNNPTKLKWISTRARQSLGSLHETLFSVLTNEQPTMTKFFIIIVCFMFLIKESSR